MKQTEIEKLKKEPWVKKLLKKLRKPKPKVHGNVKCGCGHTAKDHFENSGWCHHSKHKNPGKCGCTWFWPNDDYIKKKKNEKR